MNMVRMLSATAGAALLVAAAGQASAQSVSGDWTGFYVGGYAGYSNIQGDDSEVVLFDTNLDGTFNDTVRTTAGTDAFSPGFCNGFANGRAAVDGCTEDKNDGGEVGLRAGYDMQFGNFVVGVVGDFGTADGEDHVTAFSTTPANYSFEREINSVAAARLRLGYAYGRFLPYVTGGYAYADVTNTYSTSNGANSFDPIKNDTNADGYQVGGGIETRLTDRISVGLEYLYTDFEDDGYAVRTGPGTAPATNPFLLVNAQGTDQRRSSDEFELHSVRLTGTIRF